jgi:hypothetical protein
VQFDILEYKSICVFVVDNRKVAKPLTFNQGMKEFYIGIIVWIVAMGIATLYLFSGLMPSA